MTPVKYSPNGRFNHKYFFTCLVDFVTKNVSWRKYKGTITHPVNGLYLNGIHNRYVDYKVYDELNRQILNIYLKKDKEKKLKIQMIDSSFIANKNGSVKNNNHLLKDETKKKNIKIRKKNKKLPLADKSTSQVIKPGFDLPKNKRRKEETYIDYNRYNGRKKYHKVSILTDSIGIPLSVAMISSKQSDALSIPETINNLHINLNTLRNSKINRYKQNILGDSLYHSKKNIAYLKSLGYNPIIKYNKRNTKNKKLIKKNKFTIKEKEIYRKRIKIETTFAWIKNFPVINQNYQKKIESYNGLFLLATSILISKKI